MSFKKNIIALYLIKVSKWFTLVMPIIVLFYKECGLDLADIFILKSVYSIAMVSLEIPTGYLADVWGRRNCLIAGCIFCFLGFTNYSISDTFTAFFLSEILLGFGQSLVSGADSALLYDTMLYYKKEDAYLKYEGRVTMVGNFSEAFAGIFSGLLAVYSLRFPFYAQHVFRRDRCRHADHGLVRSTPVNRTGYPHVLVRDHLDNTESHRRHLSALFR